jgi:hypothetical protein
MSKKTKKFHIKLEVSKLGSNIFKQQTYEVMASSYVEAEKFALELAREAWNRVRLSGSA